MPLLDAHVHLPAYPDPGEVLAAASSGRMLLFSVTVSPGEAALNLRLREERPSVVRCFLGIHPSEAGEAGALEAIAPLWVHADGVGEIGLDPKYSEVSGKSTQMTVFRAQLEVAEKLGLPVQVHSRKAERLCLEVLESYRLPRVLLHWFEAEESLERALQAGCFVSFGPALLYSRKLARMARRCPPERILTESDGPVAFAALGGVAGPTLVPSVTFRLAELFGTGFDGMGRQVALNAERYLECKG